MPHVLILNYGSPVPLAKFQMTTIFSFLISSGSKKKEPRYECLSEAGSSVSRWSSVPTVGPHLSRSYRKSPGFIGFKELCSGVAKKIGWGAKCARIRLGVPNMPSLPSLPRHKSATLLIMRTKTSAFPPWKKNGNRTFNNQTLIRMKMRRKGRCVDRVWTESAKDGGRTCE